MVGRVAAPSCGPWTFHVFVAFVDDPAQGTGDLAARLALDRQPLDA